MPKFPTVKKLTAYDESISSVATISTDRKDLPEMVSIEDLGFIQITTKELEATRCKAKEYLFT